MKLILAALILALLPGAASSQSAWGTAISGALEGLGKSAEESLKQEAERDRQLQILERQHRLEMERIEREYQLRREEQVRQQALLRDRENAKQRDAKTAEIQKLEAAHPGWTTIVRTQEFRSWSEQQPESVKGLGHSGRATDAILMIDLYKRDKNIH